MRSYIVSLNDVVEAAAIVAYGDVSGGIAVSGVLVQHHDAEATPSLAMRAYIVSLNDVVEAAAIVAYGPASSFLVAAAGIEQHQI